MIATKRALIARVGQKECRGVSRDEVKVCTRSSVG